MWGPVKKYIEKGVFALSLWACLNAGMTFAQSERVSGDALTHEFTLNNGLRLIIREDHRSPTVAHMAWYKAGSIDEKNGTTGVAHVLEHMMFKGTKKLGPGEFSKQVAKLGGRENAFTSSEYTAYFQQVEKTHLEKIMTLESDRMQNLVLSEAEFKKEIQVVMEERRLRTEDQALGLLYEQFNATAFNATPKRHPVIGWMSDLQTMTYLDAQEWYRSWYSPKNAVVVIAGDVDPKEVLAIAEKTYGQVPVKDIAQRKLQAEPVQKGIRRFSLKAPAENTVMYMGWKVPNLKPTNFSEKEPYALDVLSGILDGNPNARLNRILVRDKKIATSAGAGYDSCCSRSEELFVINVGLSGKKKTDQIESEIRKIIKDIADNGVKEEELNRVKIAVTAAQVYKRDSVFGQAMEIGSMEMAGMSWRQIDEWTKNVQMVTAKEVQEVTKKYLIDDLLTIGVLDPQPIDPKTAAANARAASGLKH
jgi:zinc protease